MDGPNHRWAHLSWTWIVLAGLLIMLTTYIWIVYDPARIVFGSLLASTGMIVSVAGLAWRPKGSFHGEGRRN